MDKEAILSAYRFRHACKEFDPTRKISAEDFAFILETGHQSPSSFGLEPWKFVILQNTALREQLRQVTWGGQKQLPTASHFLLALSRTKATLDPDSAHIRHIIEDIQQLPPDVAANKKMVYSKFLQTDFGLWDNERLVFEWGSRQTYLALANMMTAAAQIGIDSCPIEGFVKEQAEQILEEAGILDRRQYGLACMVAFGYRMREPRSKTRQPLEQVVEWVED